MQAGDPAMHFLARAALLAALALPLSAADPAQTITAYHADGPVIQVALLLDDSGSMEGLINQARAQLWELVGLLGKTTRNGRHPRVEVALYHYGDLPFLVAPVVPLSSDLDQVSERLFTINGGGGTEACGQVIHNALRQLAWRQGPDALRLIVIAGNEPFTQGAYDWRAAVGEAAGSGIAVHTIHCGPRADGVEGMWEAGARLGGGTFTCIDQDASVAIRAPQDDELSALNQRLNATYLAYGAKGAAMQERQVAQDSNASSVGGFSSRAAAKASSAYENSAWDAVDAVREKKLDVATTADAELPAELRGKTPEQRTALIAEKQRERSEVQGRIAKLGAERSAWVAQQKPNAKTLGDGLRTAIQAQAQAAGFTIAQ
jgi:hypothetical protein